MAGGHAWQGEGASMARGACVVGGTCVAEETATEVGGTHSTGMHSFVS